MVRSLREGLESAKFKDWEMPATQFGGVHLWYPSLPFDSPFRNVKDYEDYISRLHQMPRALDQAMGHMRDGLRDHLMPPKFLLEKVADQAQEIADDSLEKSPFCAPLKKFPDSIGEADRKRLRTAIEDAVKNEVAPAYAKFANVCARRLRAARADGSRRMGAARWRRALPPGGEAADDDRHDARRDS